MKTTLIAFSMALAFAAFAAREPLPGNDELRLTQDNDGIRVVAEADGTRFVAEADGIRTFRA